MNPAQFITKYLVLAVLSGLLFQSITAQPLPQVKEHRVIVDTDGGYDDLRALAILLSRPEIKVNAIILTGGITQPEESYYHVNALLNHFQKESIPVIIGIKSDKPDEVCPFIEKLREESGNISGKQTELDDWLASMEDKSLVRNEYICLGPLSSLAYILSESGNAKMVKRIVWTADHGNVISGFNYLSDQNAADKVMEYGLRLDIVQPNVVSEMFYTDSIVNMVRHHNSDLAEYLDHQYRHYNLSASEAEYCKRLYDETGVIYLLEPSIFEIQPRLGKTAIRHVKPTDHTQLFSVIADLISNDYVVSSGIAFRKFPLQANYYQYDVREILPEAIELYGEEEWKACVLTDEIHGHLGIYSIVGAKMGIKAMELFNAEKDQLNVISHAGTRPPYSCLNDGIQVSTGATLGLGMIQVTGNEDVQPAAIFSYRGDTLMIRLKDKYLQQVESEIQAGIVQFGLQDDGYWKLIRHAALKYWLEWDRNSIFEYSLYKKEHAGNRENQ